MFQRAKTTLAAGNRARSLDVVGQAVRLDSERVDYQLLLYDLLQRAGEFREAARRLAQMTARFRDEYPVLLLQAQQRLDQGDVNGGDALLRRAAASGYETSDLNLGLARVAYARGLPAEGRELVAQAVRVAPDESAVLAYIGERLRRDDQLNEADAYLRRARDLGRDTVAVRLGLGEVAIAREQYAAAIEHLEKAVGLDPAFPRSRLQLGTALLLAGRAPEARPHLEEAARLMPDDPMVRLNLAVVLLKEGDRAGALVHVLAIGDRLSGNPILSRLRRDLGLEPAPDAQQPGE